MTSIKRLVLLFIPVSCSLFTVFQPLTAHAQIQADPQTGIEDENDGFVPVETIQRSTVDGKKLMLLGYGVVLAVLLGYSFSIFHRLSNIRRRIGALDKKISTHNK